jgi:hypothetical protein
MSPIRDLKAATPDFAPIDEVQQLAGTTSLHAICVKQAIPSKAPLAASQPTVLPLNAALVEIAQNPVSE